MSDTRLPWMKIHTRDTLGDSNLTGASLAARAAFWPILCLMYESPRRGYLLDSKGQQYTVTELARLCHMRKETMESALAELVSRHVFCTESSTVSDTKTVPLLSQKRMVKENEKRSGSAGRTAKHRAKNEENDTETPNTVTPNVTGRDQISEVRDQKPEGREDKKEAAVPLMFPDGINTPVFHLAWGRWIEYRAASKFKKLQPASVKAQLAECAKWGETLAIQSIDDSIRNGWKGLFEPKAKPGNLKFTDHAQQRREAKASTEYAEELIIPRIL